MAENVLRSPVVEGSYLADSQRPCLGLLRAVVQLESTPTTGSLLLGMLAVLAGGLVLGAIAHTYAGHLAALLGMGDPISAAPGIAVMLGTLIAWMVLHAQSTWTSMAFLLLSGVAGGWLLRLGLRKLAPIRALLALRRMRHAPAVSLLPSRS